MPLLLQNPSMKMPTKKLSSRKLVSLRRAKSQVMEARSQFGNEQLALESLKNLEAIQNHRIIVLAVLVAFVGWSVLSAALLVENEVESSELWNPVDMKGYKDWKKYKQSFPPSGKVTQVVLNSADDDISLLRLEVLDNLLLMHSRIGDEAKYLEYCFRITPAEPCPKLSILDAWGFNSTLMHNDRNLHATFDSYLASYSNPAEFTSVVRDANGSITSVRAVMEVWTYQPSPNEFIWDLEDVLMGTLASWQLPSVNVYVMASSSVNKEIKRVVAQDITLIAVSIVLVVVFCAIALGDRTLVGSRLLLGMIATFFMLLAFLIGIGFLPLVAQTMTPITPLVLFVLIGIGVDDVIIIVDCYNAHFYLTDQKKRMAKSLSNSGPAITLTTVTDVLAFAVGSSATMPAVRSFTITALLVICVDFLIQITVLLIFIDLDETRITNNRLDVLFCVVLPDRYTTVKQLLLRLRAPPERRPTARASQIRFSISEPLPLLPPSQRKVSLPKELDNSATESMEGSGSTTSQPQHLMPRRKSSLFVQTLSGMKRRSMVTGKSIKDSLAPLPSLDLVDIMDSVEEESVINTGEYSADLNTPELSVLELDESGDKSPDLEHKEIKDSVLRNKQQDIKIDAASLASTEMTEPLNDEDHTTMITKFMVNWYGPVLTHPVGKLLVVGVFLAWAIFCATLIPSLKQGLSLSETLPTDSYVKDFIEVQNSYFVGIASELHVVLYQPADLNWTSVEFTNTLRGLQDVLEAEVSISSFVPWLIAFREWAVLTTNSSEAYVTENFYDLLKVYTTEVSKISTMLVYKQDGTLEQIRLTGKQRISDGTWEKASDMNNVRATFATWQDQHHIDGFIVTRWYAFTDADVIIDTMIRDNLVYSGLAVLLALMFFVPPMMAVLVTMVVALIDVSILGWMYLTGVTQSPVSYIVIAMSIGVSVDYCAHIGIAFTNARLHESEELRKKTPRSAPYYVRVALEEIGGSVVAGGLSTLLGVVALAGSSSSTFLIFFKMLFAAVLFGMIHGFVFFPSALACLPQFMVSILVLDPL